MTKLSLNISGMTCGHCVRGVSNALSALEGVDVEEVKIGSAVVRYDADRVSPEQIARAVEEEGYAVVGSR